jgi:ribosomal-protein-alanine N-acetyltransferase
MSGEVELVPMRWWHIEQVIPIEAELFGREQWTAPMFWSELANRHYYMVAVHGDEVVGYAGLASAPPDEAWVQNIGVRKRYQRAGIGRRLLESLLAQAERIGCRTVLLEVAVDNLAAQELYAGYGFEGVGIRRGYYQPSNTDAVVMRRD